MFLLILFSTFAVICAGILVYICKDGFFYCNQYKLEITYSIIGLVLSCFAVFIVLYNHLPLPIFGITKPLKTLHSCALLLATHYWDVLLLRIKSQEELHMPRKPSPDSEKHIPVTISFEPEQYRQLVAYCERNDRTLAWVVRQSLKRWLEEHKDDHI